MAKYVSSCVRFTPLDNKRWLTRSCIILIRFLYSIRLVIGQLHSFLRCIRNIYWINRIFLLVFRAILGQQRNVVKIEFNWNSNVGSWIKCDCTCSWFALWITTCSNRLMLWRSFLIKWHGGKCILKNKISCSTNKTLKKLKFKSITVMVEIFSFCWNLMTFT